MPRQMVDAQNVASDVARPNLLVNGGFEQWQRGAGPFTGTSTWTADRWITVLQGTDTLSVTKSSALPDNGSAWHAQVAYTKGTGTGSTALFQQVKEPSVKNLPLTFSIRVVTNVVGCVRLGISTDGGNTWTYGAPNAISGAYTTLTVLAAANPSATFVSAALFFSLTDTIYVDNAVLVVGPVAVDFVPLLPAEDLTRCLRYFERMGDDAGGNLMFRYYAAGGSVAGGWTLLFRGIKAGNPTMNQVGTWQGSNIPNTTISFSGVRQSGIWVQILSTAVGDVYLYNQGAGSNITAEYNP